MWVCVICQIQATTGAKSSCLHPFIGQLAAFQLSTGYNIWVRGCLYTLRLIWPISYPDECDLMVRPRKYSVMILSRMHFGDHSHIPIALTLTRLLCAQRAVLKAENISSSSQAKQISARFICVYASSTLPFIAVCNRFSPFWSLFLLVSIAVWNYSNWLQNTGALELNYFVFETFYLLPFLSSVSRPQGPFDVTFVVYNMMNRSV